jgi:hypothetical protein
MLLDHNMVLSNDYSNRNRRRRRTNAPPSWAISMALAVRRCDTEHIFRCRMTRAHRKPLDAAIGQLLTPYHRCGHHNAAIGLIFEVCGVGDGAMWVDKAIFTSGCDISI